MHMAAFDTLAFSRRLRGAGFNEDQAEAVVDVVTQAVEGGVASKADVHDVGLAVANLRTEMADLRTELKQDIADLRSEMADLRTELTQRMVGLMLAQATIIIAAIKLIG